MTKSSSESVRGRSSSASSVSTSDSASTRAGASLARPDNAQVTAAGSGAVSRADIGPACALLLLAGIALGPLWRPGIPAADDLLATIYRVFVLHEGWRAGNLYPALSADLSFGYSAPLFLYYAPLATYIVELFHFAGLGLIDGLKATYLLALCLSGWGMYAYGRVILHTRRAAFVAAVAYLLAPYQLLNIFKRAALAEIVAFALLPWVFCTVHALYQRGGRARFVLAGLALAGLFIANNCVAFCVLPAILVYLAALFLARRNWPRLWLAGGALALGLGLSAFYGLPAIAEQSAVNILPLHESFADPTQHLLAWRDLLQHSLTAEYWHGQTPAWALIPALLAVGAVLTLRWQPRGRRGWLAYYAAVVAVCLLLQLRVARDFWTQVPLVRFIQFPWRLLGLVSLGGALLAGSLADLPLARLAQSAPLSRLQRRLSVFAVAEVALLVALLGFSSLARLWPGYIDAWTQGHYDESAFNLGDMYERGRTVFELFSDYQPAAVQLSMAQVAAGRSVSTTVPAPPPAFVPQVRVIGSRPLGATLLVETPAPFEVSFHYFFMPGWQIDIDGVSVVPHALGQLGLVAATVPGGSHIVNLNYANTPLRQFCSALSMLCLLLWIGIVLGLSRHRHGLALATVLVLLLGTPQGYGHSPAGEGKYGDTQVRFGDALQLVGYHLDRAAYHPGDTLKLTLFWYGLRPVDRDYKVFVHLRDAGDTRAVAQHDGQPVYGFTPTTRIEPGEILADTHVLPLAQDLAPGEYQLVTGLYDPQSMLNLPITGSLDTGATLRVLPTDRLSLAPVEILPRAAH